MTMVMRLFMLIYKNKLLISDVLGAEGPLCGPEVTEAGPAQSPDAEGGNGKVSSFLTPDISHLPG